MKTILLRLSDIKEMKNLHWRHILQSILIFACFCTLDTVAAKDNTVWLITASVAVAAIAVILFLYGKIRIGEWSNAFNIVSAGFCIGCHFTPYLLPVAMVFVTFAAGVRIVYARQKLNNYSSLVFLIASVMLGIALRYALILVPVWVLGIIMAVTVFNPVIDKEAGNQEQMPGNGKVIAEHSAELSGKRQIQAKKTFLLIAVLMLIVFFLTVEVFGGLMTGVVKEHFPLKIVNLAYLAGFGLFTAAVFVFNIKIPSFIFMFLSVIGMFFFLVPILSSVGIYFLLFIGGGIEVLVFAAPITLFKGAKKLYGATAGIFLYRLALLLRGAFQMAAGESWQLSSGFTYALAAVIITLSLAPMALLIYFDKQDTRKAVMQEMAREQHITTVKPLPATLSKREKEVALLILDGLSTEEISEKLFIADSTVRTHIKNILQKTGCDSQRIFIIRHGKTA